VGRKKNKIKQNKTKQEKKERCSVVWQLWGGGGGERF
jgi:hypothetical protein